jgi:segregation and condensation protein B
MNPEQLRNIIEAALFAAADPLNADRLQALFDEEQQPSRDTLHQVLLQLQQDYAGRGIELKEVASGFRFQARQEVSPWVSRMWEEKPQRYSRATLETLALIAYRQPITTLQERDWIRVVGHRDVPGRPAMFATTRHFLDYFNLKSLDELPPLAELMDIDKINEELDLRDPSAGQPMGDAAGDREAVGDMDVSHDQSAGQAMGENAGDVTTGDVTAMDEMDAAAESAAGDMDTEPAAATTADDTGAAGYDPAFEPTES